MNMSSEIVGNTLTNLPAVVNDNSLFSYMEKIKKFPILSEECEKKLLLDLQENGDIQAATKLITSHLRLAAKIAFTYKRYGLPMADLISEANIGLMQAVKKFDLSKNVRLSTYAIWWIKASINDYVLRSWSLVKIGTRASQKKLFYNLNRIKSRLGINNNHGLSPDDVKLIATELVVSENDVKEMNGRLGGDKSLNVTLGDESESEKIDFLVDSSQNLEAKLENKQEASFRKNILTSCVKQLEEREQYIINARMLIEKPKTLENLGIELNVSRERIRQIEKKAFDKLKSLVMLAFNKNIC